MRQVDHQRRRPYRVLNCGVIASYPTREPDDEIVLVDERRPGVGNPRIGFGVYTDELVRARIDDGGIPTPLHAPASPLTPLRSKVAN